MARLLIVDDEQSICWALRKLGEALGHRVRTASSAEEGLRVAANHPFDLLILDVRLPGVDGLSAMAEFRQRLDDAPIIVVTAFGDLSTAVEAVRNGAFEYVLKPFDVPTIHAAIDRALEQPHATTRPKFDDHPDGLLGLSPPMQAVFRKIALAANADAPVLLFGESGVGKELAAQAIHRHSSRTGHPLVAINMAALDPRRAESELFGQIDGTSPDIPARRGRLAEANGGTLFIDEVADIPLPLQVKLLRVLDSGEILPLGSDRPLQVNFRVIAATQGDLKEQVAMGNLRHDLYYRLSAFEITIPPLRDRRQDIPLLANYFLQKLGSSSSQFATQSITDLQQRPWHGNVRELRAAIEHALVVAPTGTILPAHFPPPQPAISTTAPSAEASLDELIRRRASLLLGDPSIAGHVYEQLLEEVERPLFACTMHHYDHEVAPAARALGLHRTTLKKKLDRYAIEERNPPAGGASTAD